MGRLFLVPLSLTPSSESSESDADDDEGVWSRCVNGKRGEVEKFGTGMGIGIGRVVGRGGCGGACEEDGGWGVDCERACCAWRACRRAWERVARDSISARLRTPRTATKSGRLECLLVTGFRGYKGPVDLRFISSAVLAQDFRGDESSVNSRPFCISGDLIPMFIGS